MNTFVLRVMLLVLLVGSGPARSQTPDQNAISTLMRGTFDRPDAQLSVSPIVIAGDHAIAGWTQGEMGGRALLRRKQQIWEIVLCAGDGIKSREALTKAGIGHQDAAALERDLAKAERELDPQYVAMFSRFEGMLMMDGSGVHPTGHHPAHPNH